MERLQVGHDHITLRVTTAESRGALLAVDVTIPPGGGPPAMHRHPSAEIYRVERGELAIYRDDERIAACAGGVVHIPGGVAHTVRNETGEDAHAYVVFAPGTEMEQFVRAVAVAPGDVMALAQEHGVEMVGS